MQTLEVRPSTISRHGCFTLVPVGRRKKIATYKGELIRGKREIVKRLRAQSAAGVVMIISLGESIAVDAAAGGDATAYINHSCRTNAFMREVLGSRVMFFALRDIEVGEEITIDYRDPEHPPPDGCRCGAERCRSKKR